MLHEELDTTPLACANTEEGSVSQAVSSHVLTRKSQLVIIKPDMLPAIAQHACFTLHGHLCHVPQAQCNTQRLNNGTHLQCVAKAIPSYHSGPQQQHSLCTRPCCKSNAAHEYSRSCTFQRTHPTHPPLVTLVAEQQRTE
jgi:hypothetical protein